ncbi:MAG: dicarboxylate/amino acid:cation symporter [Oscillospiraceae bacterium]|nr:dicarboxylate/amino acid:cation symporter [Oscillospiraceae bacterium]
MEQKQKKRLSLAAQIFIALVLGIAVGMALTGNPAVANGYIKPFGTIFLNLIKWVVTPLVFFSIMAGVISMRDIRKVGSVGVKTVVYYLCTTAFAITIGLILANLFKGIFPALQTTDLAYESSGPVNFMDTLVGIFPSNFLKPFVDANMLQIIVASLIIGFALLVIEKRREVEYTLVEVLNDVFMKAMEMIVKLSPIGVFCLICPVVAENGPAVLGSLAKVLLIAYLAYILHAVVVYSLSVRVAARMSPLRFFKEMLPAMMFAFSSASSVGTLPINMECTEKLGADKDVSSFVLPLGATINMDGTAIYQGVCAIFIASCYGISLSFPQMLTIVLTATLASIGTAGVPGAGMVMLAMVLQSVGLPVEGIALVAGIDRIFDMGRTTVNITGDASCAVIVSAMERRKQAKREAARQSA